MQKIVPYLWFDKDANDTAEFYDSVFPNFRVKSVQTLRNTPGGDTEVVAFDILGYNFMAISAGPLFKFNPSISFIINFDPSQDKNPRRGQIARYGKDNAPDEEGTVMFTDFLLEGQWFAAMDSARMHDFSFNEAISLMVNCDDQKEIDYYWGKLSAVREAEQCGWLKDKYGVSWQISPKALADMMKGDRAKVDRVTQAFLKMKKFDIAALERAARG
ncbi:MAG: VOC family protein [Gemmatimonadaceae bacterium]